MLTFATLVQRLHSLRNGEPARLVPDAEVAKRNRERISDPMACSTCGGRMYWASAGIICPECDRNAPGVSR